MSLQKWLLFFKRKLALPSKREVANRNSEQFIGYLRRKGVSIGQDCEFFKPATQFVDPSNPELISIGNSVKISLEVAILTHGFDYSVLRELYPAEGFGSAGPVKIGNNVFIGMRSLILKNTSIGNNCIIGAGSVVRGQIPDNVVVAGNPARVVMSVEELHQKYKQRAVDEAKDYALTLYQQRGTAPRLEDFSEFFHLFASPAEAAAAGIDVQRQIGARHYASYQANHQQQFRSFAEFLDFCGLNQPALK